MVRPVRPIAFFKTTTLRKPKWSEYDEPDEIAGLPSGVIEISASTSIGSYPMIGTFDVYDPQGLFYSCMCRRRIRGRIKDTRSKEEGDERMFRYKPRLERHLNPAFWDDMIYDED